MMGSEGVGWGGGEFVTEEIAATRKMSGKGFLIAGGSSEVQLNVIAKRVLGLPDPRLVRLPVGFCRVFF